MSRATSGVIMKPIRTVVYGPEGIGKSTFASFFPAPVVFEDTEGSTYRMNVLRDPNCSSWESLLDGILYYAKHPEECKTLVIDTGDRAEMWCREFTLNKYGKKSIEDFGYGKGYQYVCEEFAKIIPLLDACIDAGINIVINCHAQMRKFEQPDEMGAYDRWELKLIKTPKCDNCALLKEWADLLLFANFKTFVVEKDGKKKAQGGARTMYTSHHPCWDAKNRFNLPAEVDFTYGSICGIFEQFPSGNSAPAEAGVVKQDLPTAQAQTAADAPTASPVTENSGYVAPDGATQMPPEVMKLQELMRSNKVSPDDVECAMRSTHQLDGTPFEGKPMGEWPVGIYAGLIQSWDGLFNFIKTTVWEVPFEG